MTFMVKKKKFRFHVNFEIEELCSVPFVNGVLFCKTRLLDGGNFTEYSSREEVKNHVVRWRARYSFQTKMVASSTSGVLEACRCRVSVRKELKGGKSYQKLGYADLNLSEYAGCGYTSKRFLLEGYDIKRRQDNSILKINIDMTLLSGDPLFKVPESKSSIPNESIELQPENKGGGISDLNAEDSNSSGFGSLPRKSVGGIDVKSGSPDRKEIVSEMRTHARTDSSLSKSSSTHSADSNLVNQVKSYHRTPSAGSLGAQLTRVRPPVRPKLETCSSIEKRVDSTRISADDLINQLIADTDFEEDDTADTSGLQLYVGRDGSTMLGGQTHTSHIAATQFQRVIIEKK